MFLQVPSQNGKLPATLRGSARLHSRSAFTLIEILVAMTLTIFIMVILADAFTKGLDTFSGLKGVGDMNENLRAATTILRHDLSRDHYSGKRRLSDPAWNQIAFPREGAIRIGLTTNRSPLAFGGDVDLLPIVYTAEGTLNFTVKLRGNRREDFFTAPCPSTLNGVPTNFFNQPADGVYRESANMFTSQWAEVAYYLEKTGTVVQPLDPNFPVGSSLYALFRKQYLIVPNPQALNAQAIPHTAANLAAFEHIACTPDATGGKLQFMGPEDFLTNQTAFHPANAGSFPPVNAGGRDTRGRSLVLPNVLLFHVEVLKPNVNDFTDPDNNNNTPVKALRITLRVYDSATQQARQTTIIQDL